MSINIIENKNMKNELEINKSKVSSILLTSIVAYTPVLIFSVILAGAGFLLNDILSVNDNSSVTVIGVANSEKDNKLAFFTADITKKNEDKQVAVAELNEASDAVIEAIKGFGIDSKDVKTNYYNIYQNSEWDPVTQESKMTDWSATISVEVKLRDVDKAGELGNLLATLDTTYMTGPNFSLDPDEAKNNDLLADAMEDARTKAEDIATLSNRKLGKVLRVDETSVSGPVMPSYQLEGKGGFEDMSASLEAGTSSVQKSVMVTYELR